MGVGLLFQGVVFHLLVKEPENPTEEVEIPGHGAFRLIIIMTPFFLLGHIKLILLTVFNFMLNYTHGDSKYIWVNKTVYLFFMIFLASLSSWWNRSEY